MFPPEHYPELKTDRELLLLLCADMRRMREDVAGLAARSVLADKSIEELRGWKLKVAGGLSVILFFVEGLIHFWRK